MSVTSFGDHQRQGAGGHLVRGVQNRRAKRRLALTAVKLAVLACTVLGLGGLFAGPALARQGLFTCRASALRIDPFPPILPAGFEPVVANAPFTPCEDQRKTLLEIGPVAGVSSNVLFASTSQDPDHPEFVPVPKATDHATAVARASTVSVKIGTLSIEVRVLPSIAVVECKDTVHPPKLRASSALVTLIVNGVFQSVGTTPQTIPLPPFGILHLNYTLNGVNSITQRTVWLESTNPLIPSITIAESRVGYTGNPCAQ